MTASRLAVLLGALVASGAVSSQSLFPVFILDSAPRSLDGSIVAANPDPAETGHTVVTLAVDCPKTASPDNDACRAQGIYPAEVYHTQGSVYGGTVTASADDSTTTWSCALGGCGGCAGGAPDLNGNCVKTVVAGGSTRVESTSLDGCYVMGHSVPVAVTAGAEKLNSAYFDKRSPESILDAYASALESMGCPSSTSVTATAGVGGSTSAPSTGASATKAGPSKTSSSSTGPSPTESSKGSSSVRNAEMVGLTGLAAVVFSVLALLS